MTDAATRQFVRETRRLMVAALDTLTRSLAAADRATAEARGDEADRSVENEAVEWTSSLRARKTEDAAALRRAVARIDAGEYFTCEDCGGDIPRRRLEVIRTATTCVGCQAKRERAAADVPRDYGIRPERRITSRPLEDQ